MNINNAGGRFFTIAGVFPFISLALLCFTSVIHFNISCVVISSSNNGIYGEVDVSILSKLTLSLLKRRPSKCTLKSPVDGVQTNRFETSSHPDIQTYRHTYIIRT